MDFISNIATIDRNIYLAINGAHVKWMDFVMQFFSNREIWIILYLGVVIWIFAKKGWKTGLIALAFIIVTILLTDQVGNIIKDAVGRLRPSHAPDLNGITHQLEESGGLYGFPSNHALNTFGFAVISAFILKNKIYTWCIYIWAAIVSYSRIYVGKHYPFDVLAGIAIGLAIGFLCAWLYSLVENRIEKNADAKQTGATPPGQVS
jgi:undecaprenyl-diphosphatase